MDDTGVQSKLSCKVVAWWTKLRAQTIPYPPQWADPEVVEGRGGVTELGVRRSERPTRLALETTSKSIDGRV